MDLRTRRVKTPSQWSVAIVGLTFSLFVARAVSAQDHEILDVEGFQQNRDYFSEAPFENIDTLSGNLVLTFTDLALPGNAGRELRFQRTYNSKRNGRWTFGVAGVPLYIADYPNLVIPSEDIDVQGGTPGLFLGDGRARLMAWEVEPSGADPNTYRYTISSQFWRYDRTARQLSIPNVGSCTYEWMASNPPPPGRGLLRVSRCQDHFANVTTFAWQSSPAPKLTVNQCLAGFDSATLVCLGDSRVIEITLTETGTNAFPTQMVFGTHTWTYADVTSVTPPEGPGWTYTYSGTDLISVRTPQGGLIAYTYENIPYPTEGGGQRNTRVVKTRTTSDNLPAGTWTYAYEIGLDGLSSLTTVFRPITTTREFRARYRYGGLTTIFSDAVFDGEAGLVPLVERLVQHRLPGGNWHNVEREVLSYDNKTVLVWRVFGTLEPVARTITRYDGLLSGRHYSTTYGYGSNNFADYHHPNVITETGEGTRTTTRTFTHLTGPYIVALPATETVAVNGESYSKSWTYNAATGFRESETAYGITTMFAPDDYGNVETVEKGNGKQTSYTYQWGLVKDTITEEHTTTRTINPGGTVASQTQAGRTTLFGYDGLFRVTTVTAPGGTAPITTVYQPNKITVTRGASVTQTFIDGFGRPTEMVNPAGVRVRTTYDAEGRTIYEGYPFTGADIGTAIQYDALGRVTKRTNPGQASFSTQAYSISSHPFTGQNVQTIIITDEENRQTVRSLQAFGDPDQAQLVALKDAQNKQWVYANNGLGQVKQVTSVDTGTQRSWEYVVAGSGATNRLLRETHPESGTTQYTYDPAGVLASRTDARGTTFIYSHDGNDRLIGITAGSQTTTISYEPGSDNRQSASVGGVSSAFAYDGTGRLATRADTIGGKTFVTDFDYDSNDRLTAIEYPTPTGSSRRFVQFEHDSADRVSRVFEGTQNYASGFQYHASGAPLAFTSGNGIQNTMTYDADRYWPTSITAGPLGLSYQQYDKVGNVRSITDSRGSAYAQTLGYDSNDRLTSATGVYGTVGYAYDVHGNRTGSSYVYDSSTLRLMQQDGVPFTYDNNGNLKTDGTKMLDYTPDNMLKLVTGGANPISYAYDADLQRLQRTENGISTYFLRGLNGELLTEWRSVGGTAQVRDYVYAGSRLVATISRDIPDTPPDPTACQLVPVYSENFAAGNSLFTSVANYFQPTHGVDPLYPEIYRAKSVTVNTGQLVWNGVTGSWQSTGILVKGVGTLNGGGSGPDAGNGFFNASSGVVRATYTPTAASLAALSSSPLLAVAASNAISSDLDLFWTPAGGGRLDVVGSGMSPSTTPFAVVPDVPHVIRLEWRTGSVVGAPGSQTIASDGWVRVYVNNTLIIERLNVPLKINGSIVGGNWSGTNPPNLADGAWFGFDGLLGPATDLFIGSCVPQ